MLTSCGLKDEAAKIFGGGEEEPVYVHTQPVDGNMSWEDYSALVSGKIENFQNSCEMLIALSDHEYEYWADYNLSQRNELTDLNKISEVSLKWLEKNYGYTLEDIKADFVENQRTYTDILNVKIDDEAAEVIRVNWTKMYYDYSALYKATLNPPMVSIDIFRQTNTNSKNSIRDCYKKITKTAAK
jgi:hypothetical protein